MPAVYVISVACLDELLQTFISGRAGEISDIVADMVGANVFTFTPPTKFALVIGNEANGISEEMFSRSTHTVKIPMEATQESLNAAVSAGILMYILNKEKYNN